MRLKALATIPKNGRISIPDSKALVPQTKWNRIEC